MFLLIIKQEAEADIFFSFMNKRFPSFSFWLEYDVGLSPGGAAGETLGGSAFLEQTFFTITHMIFPNMEIILWVEFRLFVLISRLHNSVKLINLIVKAGGVHILRTFHVLHLRIKVGRYFCVDRKVYSDSFSEHG